MKIMLSNDDGIKAEGLNILYENLREVAEIFVIAPDKEMSGAGSSITTKRPLKPTEIKKNFVAVNGTPVDCVHLGLHQLCPFKPDLLISGINFGANMAEDLLYSGTVGAAMEGRDLSIPSIAVSAAVFTMETLHEVSFEKNKPNFSSAAQITKEIIMIFDELKVNSQVILNLNVPNLPYDEIKKIEVTTLGSWGVRNPPRREVLPSGKERFWISRRNNIPQNHRRTDIEAITRGSVSITPIGPKFLVDDYLEEVTQWLSVLK